MARIFDYEYKPGEELTLHFRLRKGRRLLSEESREHLRGAAREVLLAVRSGLDQLLSRLEERPTEEAAGEGAQEGRARRIPVE